MVQFLRRLLGVKREGIPPLLVRLRTKLGYAEGSVRIEATWGNDASPQVWTTKPAQGLCIVPWQYGRRVKLRFVHEEGVAEITRVPEDARGGSASEVWLEAATSS